jgi:hypothetical protein
LAFLVNILFSLGILSRDYEAIGINYSKRVAYTAQKLKAIASQKNFISDSLQTIQILNKWKAKQGRDKPKMVFLCTSGGGIRSATWTMRTLQFADSSLGGKLMESSALITGASGGLLGAAYYRELFLQSKVQKNVDYFERKYIENISKDILNPVVFSLVSNDLFIRTKKYNDGKYQFNADRGLVFERTLHQNLNHALDKEIFHYKNPEREALIPMMFISPVIVNDGKKLYISPQSISYMTWEKEKVPSAPEFKIIRGVEWSRFFDSCDAVRLQFSSALRMNATFPYITPNIALPTFPSIEVMDGGLGDNFGLSDALIFISVFKGWIEQETAGPVLVCIRDTPKERPFRKRNFDSWFSRLVNPLGSVYSNWARNQDYNNDLQAKYMSNALGVPLDVVTFQYLSASDMVENPEEAKSEERASLSWHLTQFEKTGIEAAILNTKNQEALNKLGELLH